MSEVDLRTWPKLLRELAEATSPGQALGFCQAFGGQAVHVPLQARPGQKIWQACGAEIARAVTRLYGGEMVDVPVFASNRTAYAKLRGFDGSLNAAADSARITRRHAARVRRRLRIEAPLPLFAGTGDEGSE